MDQAQTQLSVKGCYPHSNGGAVKKLHRPPPPAAEDVLYRECLKNHAASLGGHALDGCGEFMPSPAANTADPTSLKCAACGCHRNFHRRAAVSAPALVDDEVEGEGEDDGSRRSSSPPAPSYFTSAPHTLLALSRDGRPLIAPMEGAAAMPVRKRFRSKFSPEQKGRMLELSERLGWRMQKRDEGLVAEYCKEIGVGMGVFKIWMHNNKYHLFGSRRGDGGGGGGGGTQLHGRSINVAGELGGVAGGAKVEGNGSGVDSGEADGNGLNGSSSSS